MPDIPEVQKTLLKGLQDAGGAEGLGNLKGNKLKQKLASAWDKIKGMVSNMNTGDGKSQSIIVPNSEKILIFGKIIVFFLNKQKENIVYRV